LRAQAPASLIDGDELPPVPAGAFAEREAHAMR
jgi:hypothetical protein